MAETIALRGWFAFADPSAARGAEDLAVAEARLHEDDPFGRRRGWSILFDRSASLPSTRVGRIGTAIEVLGTAADAGEVTFTREADERVIVASGPGRGALIQRLRRATRWFVDEEVDRALAPEGRRLFSADRAPTLADFPLLALVGIDDSLERARRATTFFGLRDPVGTWVRERGRALLERIDALADELTRTRSEPCRAWSEALSLSRLETLIRTEASQTPGTFASRLPALSLVAQLAAVRGPDALIETLTAHPTLAWLPRDYVESETIDPFAHTIHGVVLRAHLVAAMEDGARRMDAEATQVGSRAGMTTYESWRQRYGVRP